MMKRMRTLRLLLPLLCCVAVQAQVLQAQVSQAQVSHGQGPQAQSLPAPQAERRPYVVRSEHGQRSDDWHWLRDDDPKAKRPEVLQHLQAENAYTEAQLAPLRGLRDRLQAEMLARVKADDSSLPVYAQGWWHWRQHTAGVEHPKLMRRRGTPEGPDPAARAEVLLDLPQQALLQRFYSLGHATVSPDGQWLAWTEDVVGRRAHDLYIQNLRTGRLQPERIRGVLETVVWAADSRTLFYVRQDPVTLQSGAVWRHVRGTPEADDTLVHDEADKTLFVELRASASRRHVLIDIHGSDTAELRAVPADQPQRAAAVVLARRPGVRVHADHLRGRWWLRTNEAAPDFRLVSVPDDKPEDRDRWRDERPARDGVALEGFALFDGALAVEERVQGRLRVRVLDAQGRDLRVVDGGEAAVATLGDNRDPAALAVQVQVQSLVRPPATLDVHLATGREQLRRQDQVKGYDPGLYRTRQLWAPARDGARVPVTLAWRADRARADGTAPLLLEVYGAYGQALEPEFAVHRISLLDRGFVIALAHVRGGSEQGQAWYEAARLLHKQRSFDDFLDVADHLLAEGWGARDKLFAQGASAGGLVVAVAANRVGTRFRGLALDVPFVDVLTTMLDASLPLTTQEWGQWGDPRDQAAYAYLAAYSPYDNIRAQDYPAMLVTAALWDSQVAFHEPVKYVARLRATKTDRHPVLLHVDLNAGHGGAAGRLEQPRHWARQVAFFLDLAGQGR